MSIESNMVNSVSLQKVESDESLISLEVPRKPVMTINRYYRFLVNFPYVVILGALVLVIICGTISLHFYPLPDFSKTPSKGFETRGTFIRASTLTAVNLMEFTKSGNSKYSLFPNVDLAKAKLTEWHKKVLQSNISNAMSQLGLLKLNGLRGMGHGKRQKREKQTLGKQLLRSSEATSSYLGESQSECPTYFPSGLNGAKFVFETLRADDDLLTPEGLHSLCNLEKVYFRPHFNCQLISITKLVSDLAKKPWCEFTDDDVVDARNLLVKCAPFFYKSQHVPTACKAGKNHEFVHRVFYYLANIDFLHPGEPSQTKMHQTVAYMFFAESIDINWRAFYQAYLENREISNTYVRLAAVDLPSQGQIKFHLFSEYLYSDMKLFVLATFLIVLVMIAYLKSVALIIATVLNVISSFVFAYFLYKVVFQIDFFPFLNVLAVLVLIAVGADDVFIFCDTWEQVRQSSATEVPYDVAMACTFRHAALSIFVTSLTTAAAFFANIVSQIPVIRCFGIFSGLSMLCNFFVMIIWTPSILIISVKLWNMAIKCCNSNSARCIRVYRWLTRSSVKLGHRIFSGFLPYLVETLWPLWLTILIGFGLSSCFVIFVNPKLRLPSSQNFQLLDSNSMLEKWDSVYRDRFQSTIDNRKDFPTTNITLHFIWGFQPNYDGFTLNPDRIDKQINEDTSFDFYDAKSQIWFKKFCESLKKAPFVHKYVKSVSCIIDHFEALAKTYCVAPFSTLLPKCCSSTTPPFSRDQLEVCGPLVFSNSSLVPRGQSLLSSDIGRLIYDNNNQVKGLVVSVYTNLRFSMSYSVMDSNYNETDTFLKAALADAPQQMKNGFFAVLPPHSFAQFYDLQREITSGTFYSIGISLGTALVVMFFATRNVLVTVYAVINIGCVILCTLAMIVLLGWDLNILESITVSLGIGLSVDFTIHYGIAYCLSEHVDSKSRTREGFARVGGAVAMSALTTFVAGSAMLPSHVLAYYKLGAFLMIIMSFSWLYSTFLFQSLCRIIGPKGNFCQVPSCHQRPRSRGATAVSEVSSVITSEDGPAVFTSTYVSMIMDRTTVSTNDVHSFNSIAI